MNSHPKFQYKTVITSLETQLKESLSLNVIHLHKAQDDTLYSESSTMMTSSNNDVTSSQSFKIPAETEKPGVLRIKKHWQMLYQVVWGVFPVVKPVDGDSLVLKLATKHEIRLEEALNGQKRKF